MSGFWKDKASKIFDQWIDQIPELTIADHKWLSYDAVLFALRLEGYNIAPDAYKSDAFYKYIVPTLED